VGLIVGWLSTVIQKRIEDPPIEITLSILTPFAAYLPAEQLGVSGVLAVVSTGLYYGWRIPEITSPKTRLQAGPVWEMIEFLLNGFVFLLIGLQLPGIWDRVSARSHGQLVRYAVVISVAVILLRILWVFPATYLPRWLFSSVRSKDPSPPRRSVALVAWTGMRGVVSLAAALGLPVLINNGSPFPERDLILFLTFSVIIATLVVQGLTLPLVVRWLGVRDDGSAAREEHHARLKANRAALEYLNRITEDEDRETSASQRLRIEYEDRIRQLEITGPNLGDDSGTLYSTDYDRLAREILQIERDTLIRLRNERVINDEILRLVQRDIDLAEAHLGHH
jgi:Na+/H+ antiporter